MEKGSTLYVWLENDLVKARTVVETWDLIVVDLLYVPHGYLSQMPVFKNEVCCTWFENLKQAKEKLKIRKVSSNHYVCCR